MTTMITEVTIETKDSIIIYLTDVCCDEEAEDVGARLEAAAEWEFMRFCGVCSDRVHYVRRKTIREITVKEI